MLLSTSAHNHSLASSSSKWCLLKLNSSLNGRHSSHCVFVGWYNSNLILNQNLATLLPTSFLFTCFVPWAARSSGYIHMQYTSSVSIRAHASAKSRVKLHINLKTDVTVHIALFSPQSESYKYKRFIQSKKRYFCSLVGAGRTQQKILFKKIQCSSSKLSGKIIASCKLLCCRIDLFKQHLI